MRATPGLVHPEHPWTRPDKLSQCCVQLSVDIHSGGATVKRRRQWASGRPGLVSRWLYSDELSRALFQGTNDAWFPATIFCWGEPFIVGEVTAALPSYRASSSPLPSKIYDCRITV